MKAKEMLETLRVIRKQLDRKIRLCEVASENAQAHSNVDISTIETWKIYVVEENEA
jgi:hypothetical protein